MSSRPNPLILAVDTTDRRQAREWVQRTREAVGAIKLGLEFLHSAGPEGVRELQAVGAERVFLDTKFCDIPNTVAGAVRAIAPLRPWMFNLHALAGPAAIRAAVAEAERTHSGEGARPLVIAVTVLTSLAEETLGELGLAGPVESAVVRLSRLAQDAGADGVVASPREVAALRRACGPDFLLVTPGVRPAGADSHDQERVATPGAAIRDGADYLVIGRAATAASDPVSALAAIRAEAEAARL
ncbi:MAG: orotidine-5'-phosphate decarboxylase [Armatimonadetes bacterium]|nr:orotidine-5'-phosphate decarboxylase [Armatimonadota bacterium]